MLTADLTGDLLALWVARAEGMEPRANHFGYWVVNPSEKNQFEGYIGDKAGDLSPKYAPHENWAQGGPIIEREKIGLVMRPDGWLAGYAHHAIGTGGLAPTPLIAAMRAFVASKFCVCEVTP
jgi:hypothetical protein